MDGLFEVAPDFTPGFGSEQGRGYVVSLRVATQDKVPPDQIRGFMEEAAGEIRKRLPRFFPNRRLEVVWDRGGFKIIGDFSLGEA
jgi:hypothetical protein